MIYTNDFTNELIQFFVKLSGFEIHINALFIMGFSRLMHEIETKDPKQWARIENIINQIITAQNSNKAVEIHETITTKLSIPLQRILETSNMKYYVRHKQEAEETAF